MPTWLMAVLVPLAAALLTAAVTWLVGRLGWSANVTLTPVVGAVTSAMIFFYFGTLAFLLVTSTAAVSGARQNTLAEAGALRDGYIAARELPEPQRTEVRGRIADYTRLVVEQEWPMQTDGGFSAAGWDLMKGLQSQVAELPSLPEARDPAVAQAVKDLHDSVRSVYAERRVREGDVTRSAPALVVGGVGAMGVAAVAAPLVMGWPLGRRYLFGMALLGGSVALGFWLFTQIDLPYSNGMHVGPGAFQQALEGYSRL